MLQREYKSIFRTELQKIFLQKDYVWRASPRELHQVHRHPSVEREDEQQLDI